MVCVVCTSMAVHMGQNKVLNLPVTYAFFQNGDTIVVEPWRSAAFPVIKDLAVDRSAFDRIIASGGYISVNTGNAQDAKQYFNSKTDADEAFEQQLVLLWSMRSSFVKTVRLCYSFRLKFLN